MEINTPRVFFCRCDGECCTHHGFRQPCHNDPDEDFEDGLCTECRQNASLARAS